MENAVERCVKERGAIDYVTQVVPAIRSRKPPTCITAPVQPETFDSYMWALFVFKTVIEIDTLGLYNTLKAKLPHFIKSAKKNPKIGRSISTGGSIIFVSATFHYTGVALQAHAATASAGVDAISGNLLQQLNMVFEESHLT